MISVVITVYNLSPYIEEALDSVRAQTDSNWEAVVVDDCSTDDSRAVIERYIDRTGDRRIRLVSPEQNGGVSAARNLGARHAVGDWLAFFDGDDKYQTTFLEKMLGAGSKRNAGVVHCEATLWDPERGAVGRYRPDWFDRLNLRRSLCRRNFIIPSCMLCSREAWEAVGPYDTDPEIQHAEDWDWVLRAAHAGVAFVYVRDALTLYRRHENSAMTHRYRQYRRALYLIRKHAKFPDFAPLARKARITSLRTLAYRLAKDRPDYSIILYRRAIRLQPTYLPAYVRLAVVGLMARGLEGWVPSVLRMS